MSNVADPTTIYPRYCFHLAPTFDVWCLLRIREVHQLEQHDGFQGENFFFRNLPMKWIRVVGVVVAVDDFGGRRVYVIDDGSKACIEALVLVPKAPATLAESDAADRATVIPTELIDVGVVVDVKGELTTYRDEKQIKVVTMRRLRGSAQEQALREKRDRFRCEVLQKPWVLRNRDVRRCRKEAERSDADTVRKKTGHAVTTHGAGAVTSTLARTKQVKKTQDGTVGTLKNLIRSGQIAGKYPALGL